MAYTIHQQPGLHTPVYNPMVFVVESTNTAQPNHQYLADVYVSGQGTAYVARLTFDAEPSYGQGVFDIARILESYLSFDISDTAWGFQKATNSLIAYEVKFGERYGTTVTDYPNITVTGTLYAHNAVYTTHDFLQYDGADVAIEDAGIFLTDMISPITITANGNEDLYFHYITNTSGSAYFAEIRTFDENDSLIQTVKIENPYQAVSAYDERRMYFMAGPRALNAATLYSGSQPVIDSSVYKYTVNIRDWANNTPLYTFFTVNVNHNCNGGRSPLVLHWLNSKGGFDSYQFTMVNRLKIYNEKTTYDKKLGTVGDGTWSYAHRDAGKSVLDSKERWQYELLSDWISVDESSWLYSIILSPVVYMQLQGDLTAVTVKSPNMMDVKSYGLGDTELQQYKVVVEFAMEYNRQRA